MRNLHLYFAHLLWLAHLKPGDCAIDATCGNGHDTLAIAKMCLCQNAGEVHAIDIQKKAIDSSYSLLQKHLPTSFLSKVKMHHQSHKTLPKTSKPPRLIAYNLGYLPGGDKTFITTPESTLNSLKEALQIKAPDGLISIMCYPGHSGGGLEALFLRKFLKSLKPQVSYYQLYNYKKSPFLIKIK